MFSPFTRQLETSSIISYVKNTFSTLFGSVPTCTGTCEADCVAFGMT